MLCSAGKQAEEESGAERHDRGEEHDAALQRELQRDGGFGRQQRRHERERPARDDQARDAAEHREHTDSVSSCASSCRRLAPSESRTAISVARPAPRASSRFAMLAHAMSSTMPVTRISKHQRRPRLAVHRALAARSRLRRRSSFALNLAIVWSLMPFCSGASTSVMIGL